MSMLEKVTEIFELQDQLNKQIHPEWENQGYNWDRAICQELSELIDHIGWKWWKHQKPDWAQAKLEVVDVFHFLVCKLIESDISPNNFDLGWISSPQKQDPETAIRRAEWNMLYSLENEFKFDDMNQLCNSMGMTFDDLYSLYMGKHALNELRQENGYKTGEYQKIWAGQEDNVHMMELAESLKDQEGYRELIKAALRQRYTLLTQTKEAV